MYLDAHRGVGQVDHPVREVPRCLVMGILNVTSDSFSDGGRFERTDNAIRHGLQLASDGADIVDIGGESTRPGAQRVSRDREASNVLPVIRALASSGITVSVDTTRAAVADAALEAGAVIINDVSGGLADGNMAALVACADVPYVAMHWRAPSAGMQSYAHYIHVVDDVVGELSRRLDALVVAGVNPERVVLDPGLGFAKLPEHDWQLLSSLDRLSALGRPILIGASRKSFLGHALTQYGGVNIPAAERDAASTAVAALAAAAGASCVRVHDVRSAVHAVAVAAAMAEAGVDVRSS